MSDKTNPAVHGPRHAPPVTDPSSTASDVKRARMEFCKRSAKVIMTNVVLCLLVTLFAVAGGIIFQHLEDTNEREECVQTMNKYFPMENATVRSLWEISLSYPDDDDLDLAVVEFRKQVEKFRDDVLTLNYDGSNCTAMGQDGGPSYKWSFPGALLFSVTVFTTIG